MVSVGLEDVGSHLSVATNFILHLHQLFVVESFFETEMAFIIDNSIFFLSSMIWWSCSKAWFIISVTFSLQVSTCTCHLVIGINGSGQRSGHILSPTRATIMAFLWILTILPMSAILWSLWRMRVQSLHVSNYQVSQKLQLFFLMMWFETETFIWFHHGWK